ncbi:hypothetical protein GCM10022417_18680 [Corynebacterium pilbarense]
MVADDAEKEISAGFGFALIFVAPAFVGIYLLCLVLGIPLQRQPLNQFWGDIAYVAVGVLATVVMIKVDSPYGVLPGIMPYVVAAILLTGVSAALRRLIAFSVWKRKSS